jgi:hypothetical protein
VTELITVVPPVLAAVAIFAAAAFGVHRLVRASKGSHG